MNTYTDFEKYTKKEISIATDILKSCDKANSMEEVIETVRQLAGDLTRQERENIIEIINKAYNETHKDIGEV